MSTSVLPTLDDRPEWALKCHELLASMTYFKDKIFNHALLRENRLFLLGVKLAERLLDSDYAKHFVVLDFAQSVVGLMDEIAHVAQDATEAQKEEARQHIRRIALTLALCTPTSTEFEWAARKKHEATATTICFNYVLLWNSARAEREGTVDQQCNWVVLVAISLLHELAHCKPRFQGDEVTGSMCDDPNKPTPEKHFSQENGYRLELDMFGGKFYGSRSFLDVNEGYSVLRNGQEYLLPVDWARRYFGRDEVQLPIELNGFWHVDEDIGNAERDKYVPIGLCAMRLSALESVSRATSAALSACSEANRAMATWGASYPTVSCAIQLAKAYDEVQEVCQTANCFVSRASLLSFAQMAAIMASIQAEVAEALAEMVRRATIHNLDPQEVQIAKLAVQNAWAEVSTLSGDDKDDDDHMDDDDDDMDDDDDEDGGVEFHMDAAPSFATKKPSSIATPTKCRTPQDKRKHSKTLAKATTSSSEKSIASRPPARLLSSISPPVIFAEYNLQNAQRPEFVKWCKQFGGHKALLAKDAYAELLKVGKKQQLHALATATRLTSGSSQRLRPLPIKQACPWFLPDDNIAIPRSVLRDLDKQKPIDERMRENILEWIRRLAEVGVPMQNIFSVAVWVGFLALEEPPFDNLDAVGDDNPIERIKAYLTWFTSLPEPERLKEMSRNSQERQQFGWCLTHHNSTPWTWRVLKKALGRGKPSYKMET